MTSQGDRTLGCTKPGLRVKRDLVCDTAFQSNRRRIKTFHPRNCVQ